MKLFLFVRKNSSAFAVNKDICFTLKSLGEVLMNRSIYIYIRSISNSLWVFLLNPEHLTCSLVDCKYYYKVVLPDFYATYYHIWNGHGNRLCFLWLTSQVKKKNSKSSAVCCMDTVVVLLQCWNKKLCITRQTLLSITNLLFSAHYN